jgi:hypothetical protein
MSRFTVKTGQGLFPPIEVEIEGKVLQVRKMTRAVTSEVSRLAGEIKDHSIDAIYKELEILLGPCPEIDGLDLQEASQIFSYIMSELTSRAKGRNADDGGEKNAPEPGGESTH